MHDSKFVETIRTYSPEECESFVLFLKSPFFVREDLTEELLGIYQFLRHWMADGTETKPGKQALHAAGYPDKPYSEARVDRAIAKLGQLSEQFLLFSHHKEQTDELSQQIQLARILRIRNAYALADKKVREAHKITEKGLEESLPNYWFQYQVALEEYECRAPRIYENNDQNIPQTLERLHLFYNAKRAKLLNHLLVQQWTNAKVLPNIEQLILKFRFQGDAFTKEHPLLFILQNLQNLLLQERIGKQEMYDLMALIEEHEKKVSHDLVQEFYTILRNICTALARESGGEMYEVLFKIQLDNLEKGFLYYHGRIPPYALLNITRIGIIIKKYALTRSIIEAHRYRVLSDDEHEELYKINMAFCFFAEKKFEEAAQYLAFPTKPPYYVLSARRLEVMIHYELQSEVLLYKIDALRKFLERTAAKEIAGVTRKQNLNFVNITLQLAQSRVKDHKRSLQLINRITTTTYLSERPWLLEKAKDLG